MAADPFRSLLPDVLALAERVQNPVQYLGGEFNLVRKDARAMTGRIALCYPDTYEVGSSHNGLQILYQIVNSQPDLAAERCFTPWPDMADALRTARTPLFTLESHLPVSGFDVLGFTLQTELTYSNVLETLDLAGLPLLAAERNASHPVVVAGGHGAHSPETLAAFIDVFLPGDGEEIIVPLLRFVAERRRAGRTREQLLHELAASFPFAYVPSLYDAAFDPGDGPFRGLTPRFPDVPRVVKGAAVFDFSSTPMATHPVVPHARSVQDRISLEIMRGCTRGCRFCQAGMITRPMRYRTVEQLLEAAEETWRATGYDSITLTSLSSGDYPWIEELLRAMAERFSPRGVSISLPSLRVTGELARLPALTAGVRKSGMTFAPEVATDRLRRIINKDIRNEDVLASAAAAYKEGWAQIKLYYMIGIPGEHEEDLRAIVECADELSKLRQRVTGQGPAQVNVTVSTFVPKAFVPFQWDGMMDRTTIAAKQSWMRGLNRNRRVKLKFHDADQSYLEGILARGDRRLAPALIEAHRRGARFDAWSEHFQLQHWLDAFAATGIDPDAYALRERARDEALPWDHLDVGPSRDYLWAERERARAEMTTEYCVGKVCHVCGVPPSLCFAIKRDMGLLPSSKRRILEQAEDGTTRGLAGVTADAPRRLRAASPGPVRRARSGPHERV
ncbi:MAG: TIGR03960 family B12-binding radical SAM protein [Planctomycetota bacterium]